MEVLVSPRPKLIGTPMRCISRWFSIATNNGPQRLTLFTWNTLHAVCTAVAMSASDNVYTTRASSSDACLTILYTSLPSERNRNTYKLVGALKFITSANWLSAARHVFAALSPVQSLNTKIGFGSISWVWVWEPSPGRASCWDVEGRPGDGSRDGSCVRSYFASQVSVNSQLPTPPSVSIVSTDLPSTWLFVVDALVCFHADPAREIFR
mmetsp:Transcript_2526/g.9761  ORF Transcript_2526/g.9761 Transcript_2526/m.9761 type:complete len:209 (-) Transcript_2526:1131-1757(-)